MKNDYLLRIVDKILTERLESIGAVLITGPKWCGKTTTAEQQAKSILKLQDPDKTKGYLVTADLKPTLLLKGESPRLIDEWQMAPVLWDAVRNTVDERGENGLFILTGSASVDERAIIHPDTEHISRMVMYPMSLFESLESNGKISLEALFNNPDLDIDGIMSDLDIEELVFSACRGGLPSSLKKKTERAMLFEAQDYIANICDSYASAVDGVKRSPERVKAVLQSYARNISTLTTIQTILKDVSSNYNMSVTNLYSYLNILERLYVIEDVPAWCPPIRSATTILATKKKEFTDPSIAVASFALSPHVFLQDFNTFGFIFECLCFRDLKVYSTALGGRVSYYRDRYGLEADCVLHLADGRYALIEFKLGNTEIEEGAAHLIKLKNLIRKANMDNRTKLREPEFLLVLSCSDMSYRRHDGVYVVPIGCLRD